MTNTNTDVVYQELQELAASYFICGIPVCIIETCYQKYFMRSLDYHSLGVRNIDELLERMGDMVVVFEERESNGKYVMPALMSPQERRATMLVLSRDTVKADIYFVWAPAATNETSATKLQTLP
ncbi:hypothetical protein Tco_1568780 [Tanacetum coccineum]